MQGHLALLKRLGNMHENEGFIREEVRKKEAGERGEDRLLMKLGELRLPGPFRIFSDVALHVGDWKVQIDCLVVTDRSCIVLESKNMSGDLNFDTSTEEFYRIEENNLETPFPNPYFQLMRNIRFMKDLLRTSFPELQVTGAIVMTSKSCRIRNKPSHYPMFKLESIMEKIIHMYNHSTADVLSDKQLDTLESMIRMEQSSFTYPPLCEHYRISPNDLIRGVECPHCGVFGMQRTGKTWTCSACNKKSRDAHKNTVQDYFWLVNKQIRNKDFRIFCQIDSVYAASRMLNNMNLQVHKAGPRTFYTQKKDR